MRLLTSCTVVSGNPAGAEQTLDPSPPLALHLPCGLEIVSPCHFSLFLRGSEFHGELSRGVWSTAAGAEIISPRWPHLPFQEFPIVPSKEARMVLHIVDLTFLCNEMKESYINTEWLDNPAQVS